LENLCQGVEEHSLFLNSPRMTSVTLNRASTYLQHIMIYIIKVATHIISTWLELRI